MASRVTDAVVCRDPRHDYEAARSPHAGDDGHEYREEQATKNQQRVVDDTVFEAAALQGLDEVIDHVERVAHDPDVVTELYLVEPAMRVEAAYPAELVFADATRHMRAAFVLLDHRFALRALADLDSGELVLPVSDSSLEFALGILAVVALAAKLAYLLLAGRTDNEPTFGVPFIEHSFAVRPDAEHQVLAIFGH